MNRFGQPFTPIDIFIGIAHAGVGQDKAPHKMRSAASGEPETAAGEWVDRTKKPHGSEKRRTEHVSSRIPPADRIGLQRIAKANNWSESRTVAQAIHEFIENDLGEKFGLRLSAIVVDSINKNHQRQDARQGNLVFQAVYAAEQARIFNIHILRFLLGEGINELPLIIEECRKQAWHNLKPHVQREERGGEGGSWQL